MFAKVDASVPVAGEGSSIGTLYVRGILTPAVPELSGILDIYNLIASILLD